MSHNHIGINKDLFLRFIEINVVLKYEPSHEIKILSRLGVGSYTSYNIITFTAIQSDSPSMFVSERSDMGVLILQ